MQYDYCLFVLLLISVFLEFEAESPLRVEVLVRISVFEGFLFMDVSLVLTHILQFFC